MIHRDSLHKEINKNQFQLFLGLWQSLSKKRKIKLVFLSLLIVLNSFSEVFSLAALVPFLMVLNHPEKLIDYSFINKVFIYFGFQQSSDLLLPVTFIFIISVLTAGSIRLLNLWYSGRISVEIGTDISREIYRRILLQDYSYHLQKESSEIITILTSFISHTISVLRTILNLLTSLVIAIGIIFSLFFINWHIALTSLLIFGFSYLILALFVRSILISNSKIVADACERQIQILQESLGGIRDIILDSNQNTFLEIFKNIDRSFRFKANQNQFIGAFPKYIIESLGLIILAFFAFYIVSNNEQGIVVIPFLGAFALGAQKLLPSLQQIYSGWSTVNSCLMELNVILEMLKQPVPLNSISENYFNVFNSFNFENVSFKYSVNDKYAIKNINFNLKYGEMIGLMGANGSGKSTTVDLIMGLLKPTSGKIFVDGNDLHDIKSNNRINSWRSLIAHVPQNVFISSSTVRDNIAFGMSNEIVDEERIILAAKQSFSYDFIKKLPLGFDTKLGERGANLSGGQLQRIGLARALYKKSNVLILDEATSALDKETEQKVLNSISKLKNHKLIIIISHKKSLLKNCDRLIKLSKGLIT